MSYTLQEQPLFIENLEERMLLAGDIALVESRLFPAGQAPARIHAGDVDLDGMIDLVVPNHRCCGGQHHLLLGNGDGSFKRPETLKWAGQVADFDNDGELDMIHLDGPTNTIRILLNAGIDADEGRWLGFGTPRQFPIADASRLQGTVGIADFDGDGDMDIAVADNQSVWTLHNYGHSDGVWQGLSEPRQKFDAGLFPDTVIPGDLNLDGNLDLVVGNYVSGDVSVLIGDGDGMFGALGEFPVGHETTSVNVADFNGDGILDVAALTASVGPSEDVTLLLGIGDGSFAAPVAQSLETDVDGISSGDLDGDEDVDLITISYEDPSDHPVEDPGVIRLLVNNGDGTFVEMAEEFIGSSPIDDVILSDLDGDGDKDIAAALFSASHGPDGVVVLLNETQITTDPIPGDANGDGIFNSTDLIAVFQAGEYEDGLPRNSTFEEGDWNGDGEFDSGDLVLAFQAGHYIAAAIPLESRIAAAVDWLFAHDDDDEKSALLVT